MMLYTIETLFGQLLELDDDASSYQSDLQFNRLGGILISARENSVSLIARQVAIILPSAEHLEL
jgi:hypothetical protein